MTNVAETILIGDTNEAFAVEQNGINLIPDSERKGEPRDLAWVFAGANLVFINAISGSLLATFGFNYPQMLAVVLSANLLWLIVGYGGIPGARTGTSTMVISRAAFGRQGNVIPSLLSWLTVVGWEAVNLVLGAFALFSLMDLLGYPLDTTGKVIALAAVTVLTFGVAILGHATIVVMQRVFTWALALIMLGLIPQVWAAPPLPVAADAADGASLAMLCVGFTLIAALPISFTNYPADYTRYLPRATSGASITLWTFLGAYLATVLMMIVGFIAAKAANLADPVAGFQPLLAPWYFKMFLIVVLGGTMTNNFVNTYSSGLSLLAAGLNVSRPVAIIIDAVLAIAMAGYAIFFYDFTPSFILFLSLMVAWLAPWAGVYTADIWLRRSSYDGAALLSADGGQYRYWSGWHGAGYAAWLAGVAAALACTTADLFKSPFAAEYLGGADLSIVVGFIVSALLYVLLAGSKLRAA
jgi:nucleobase:cation symporter-1, NCS1 family